ncbi:MAG: type I-B CRISPR-associated endonuclease Cas1b [Candidatus Kapabacteria bacterium]|nr:type I-B CRISPR-associated endonuclease Cas1b [Candidatus Kapabacteria bacterium]MCS7169384.1 type I-B CRISPR-associated endonuclease Cas1b [Candidatus Kapabacteria bacterium]MDW8225344.1 type I-B CRISPR-associated endonuclease Cas1b [Bacteroidota bacterium]
MPQSYYIFRHGRLRRHQNTLYFEQEDEAGNRQRQPIPIETVRDLYLFGELELNTRLLSFLARHGVVVHCFNYHGFYVGSFYPRETNVSGHLLVRQVEHYLVPERRLYLAREFVVGALFHIRRNLNYYRNRGKAVDDAWAAVQGSIEGLEACTTIPELMSEEGHARTAYYSAFNEILELEEPFDRRVRRPPNNMVNALLSFGNSLLYAAVLTELYVTQLNPTISYLHEPSHRRFSLALDIAEIFKPLLVDRMLFRMLNRNELDESDFEQVGEAGGVYLGEAARRKVVRTFEETMQTTVQHRYLKRKVSYRQLLRLEGYRLIRHLIGMEQYRAFRAWW